MKVVIDAYALLGTIGGNRKAFSGIEEQVRKQALALLAAQLKHKELDLAQYRSITSAITSEQLELFLDTADHSVVKAVSKKLDPHATVTRSADAGAIAAHLIDLGTGEIEPTQKPVRTSPSKKPAKPAAKRAASDSTSPHAIAAKPPGRR